MKIYNIYGYISDNDKVKHSVIPYNILGTIKVYFSKNFNYGTNGKYNLLLRIKEFSSFLSDCRPTKKMALKEALRRDNHHDLEN